MRKKYIIKLEPQERKFLKGLISKGKEKARKLTRCRVLLLSDEGKSDTNIIEILQIARNTVRQICQRYVRESLESALNEKPRSGAPDIFSGRAKAKITALACSKAPDGHSQWSLRLLADKAIELKFVDDISHMSVQRILKKTKLARISSGNGA